MNRKTAIVADRTPAIRSWRRLLSRVLVVAMMVALSAPAASLSVYAGQKGKKHYTEGQKLEAVGKFDQAAEKYLMALSEGDRPEYRIAYRRAALQASLTLTRQGRELIEHQQYEEAYNAFRRAYQFDQTNELAKELAKKALETLRKGGEASSGPSSSTYGSPGPPELQSGRAKPEDQPPPPSPPPAKQDIIFRDQLKAVVTQLGRQLGLNVMFDSSVQQPDRRIDLELRNVTKAQALDIILQSNLLFFQPIGDNTIVIAQDNLQNRQRLQQSSVQTFYLKHIDGQQIQLIQGQIALFFQQRVHVIPIPDLRALVVKGSPENLKLVGEIIDSLDKEKPEVVIDVSIYEVANNDLQEIGNQLLYDGFLGQSSSGVPRPSSLNFLGVTVGQILTEQRLALAIPTSIIRTLQTKGRSNLIDSIQVHALDGQQVQANIGRAIPIQTASFPSYNPVVNVTPNPQNPNQNPFNNNIFGGFGGYPQIDYRDVGLNVTITPTVYGENDVKLEMQVETSGFNEGPTNLTPIITKRSLKSFATVKSGQAAMMAGVTQRREGQTRTSLPVIGFLPVVGRFFSIPRQSNDTTEIVITVTPHIVRATPIEDKDRLARLAGTGQSFGATMTIEGFVEQMRARERAAASVDIAKAKTGAETPGEQPPAQKLEPEQKIEVVTPPAGTPGVNQTALEGDPINVTLQMNTATPRQGEWIQVAVFLNGRQEIREGTVTVNFDPQRLRVMNVADGGVLTTSEAPAEVQSQIDASGKIVIGARIGGNSQPRPARGRLAVILFEVLASGSSQLQVDTAATSFTTADGKAVGCKSVPLTVAAR